MMSHHDYFLAAFQQWLLGKQKNGELLTSKVLLDVGCRDTVLQHPLEDMGFTWYGVDKEIANTDNTLQARMEDLSFINDNAYDIVLCCHSFEHCERPIDALREFQRILKPGGWLFIGGPYPCHKQITAGDHDHIFVLNEMQLHKLLTYTKFENVLTWNHPEQEEQNHTICGVGRKPV